jgi:hypothetical protein
VKGGRVVLDLVVIYLRTLVVAQMKSIYGEMIAPLVNNEWERMLKEAVVA